MFESWNNGFHDGKRRIGHNNLAKVVVKERVVVVVGGHGWSILPQIGRWGARGRLVVAMGHNSACGVVVVSVWGPTWTMVGAGSQGKAPHWVVVGGEKWSELPQIGRWWVQGRLVVGMGHTS